MQQFYISTLEINLKLLKLASIKAKNVSKVTKIERDYFLNVFSALHKTCNQNCVLEWILDTQQCQTQKRNFCKNADFHSQLFCFKSNSSVFTEIVLN